MNKENYRKEIYQITSNFEENLISSGIKFEDVDYDILCVAREKAWKQIEELVAKKEKEWKEELMIGLDLEISTKLLESKTQLDNGNIMLAYDMDSRYYALKHFRESLLEYNFKHD